MLTKVRHSAFYSTPLGYLLGRIRTERVIVTGQCIRYTDADAYARPDTVAHIDVDFSRAALQMMRQNMVARLLPAAQCL